MNIRSCIVTVPESFPFAQRYFAGQIRADYKTVEGSLASLGNCGACLSDGLKSVRSQKRVRHIQVTGDLFSKRTRFKGTIRKMLAPFVVITLIAGAFQTSAFLPTTEQATVARGV